MADDVVGLRRRCRERQHDPPPERLRHAADRFANLPFDDVGLLEVRMARVEDQRLSADQLVGENVRKPRIPPLRHLRGLRGGVPLLAVEVDVEVPGLQHLESEGAVLDFVAPAVLSDGRLSDAAGERDEKRGGRPATHHYSGGGASSRCSTKRCSATGRPPIRCSWIIRSRTGGSAWWYHAPSG